jgi:hypothetical protein
MGVRAGLQPISLAVRNHIDRAYATLHSVENGGNDVDSILARFESQYKRLPIPRNRSLPKAVCKIDAYLLQEGVRVDVASGPPRSIAGENGEKIDVANLADRSFSLMASGQHEPFNTE